MTFYTTQLLNFVKTGVAEDVNTIARFISCKGVPDFRTIQPVNCITLCVFSALHSWKTVFDIVQARPGITKTLILCGGIGHSTELINDAFVRHLGFREVATIVRDQPAGQVLPSIFQRSYASRLPDEH